MLTDNQKIFLAQSAEFQKLLAGDPALCDLEAQQYDPAAEFFSLMEMLRCTFTIGKLVTQPLTPAVWAFLWGIGNHYTGDLKKITEADTDIFLFLLANGVKNLDCTPAELPAQAAGFCPASGLDYAVAAKELVQTVNFAFRPFEMMPKTTGKDTAAPARYDAFWIAQLCSIVAQETGETANAVMFGMPLSACHYFFVNYVQRNDPKRHIRRRTPEEIQKEIFDRVNVLAENFVAENYGGI